MKILKIKRTTYNPYSMAGSVVIDLITDQGDFIMNHDNSSYKKEVKLKKYSGVDEIDVSDSEFVSIYECLLDVIETNKQIEKMLPAQKAGTKRAFMHFIIEHDRRYKLNTLLNE